MRWVTGFAFFVAGLASARLGVAEPAKRAGASAAIPLGSGWHCFQSQSKWNARDRSGNCFRESERCEARRENLASESNEYSTEITACRAQAKAAIVTYFDVMHDSWLAWALPSTDLWNETRQYLQRSRDHRSISRCQLVGDRLAPPARVNLDAIPAGEVWHCSRTGLCSRDPTECLGWQRSGATDETSPGDNVVTASHVARNRCRTQTRAAVLTGGGADGMPLFAAFVSTEACQAVRGRAVSTFTQVSACTVVGAIARPAADRSLIPDGNSWFCYESANEGLCERTEADCESLRGLGDSADAKPCHAVTSAVVRTDDGEVFAYPTKQWCERRMTASPTSSRCESVR